jgi:pullulanase
MIAPAMLSLATKYAPVFPKEFANTWKGIESMRASFAIQLQHASVWRMMLMATTLFVIAALPGIALSLEPRWGLSQCDEDGFQQVMRPSVMKNVDARAVWLNRNLIRWPNKTADGQFKLYYDRSGQIQASKGGKVSTNDSSFTLLPDNTALPGSLSKRFNYLDKGVTLRLEEKYAAGMPALQTIQLVLVQEDANGNVLDYTTIQIAGVLDDVYRAAEAETELGVTVSEKATQFKLWAPTAESALVCVYDTASGKASQQINMQWNKSTGIWSAKSDQPLRGKYYRYMIEGFVHNYGTVRNFVTDPYSISLSADSKRSYIANLDDVHLKPENWDASVFPEKVKHQTDMVIYELHVRDFSINDASVSEEHRGRYSAFTQSSSRGMQHLTALSNAGLTDVHLLPVFDIATIPEKNCVTPVISGTAGSETQQATIAKTAGSDCFNWGYDPYHFNAPEGSYSSNADEGAARVIEFRRMVMALHEKGLRVGMDVVYNHTSTSGQDEKSVLDRIVPGYYQRLDANGKVERSTCCDNTATEHMMMNKLMRDSTVLWAKHYKIDSFRFDLMGHQPRDAMVQLQQAVNQATGRKINLIGEGWNFGEVANGARFVQASQLSLNGTGIGTFSDRARDAVRGGHPGDSGEALAKAQGYINGLSYDANALNKKNSQRDALVNAAEMIRVGLAGSLRDYEMIDQRGDKKRLHELRYGDQPAGYVSQPGEVVNYVDNHDNQTLFDINAYKLPLNTSAEDRARAQVLGMAINTFSQGVAYFHAGIETLRSKSMDGNSYDSGDWFNRLDWQFKDNYFATGLPPKRDNERSYAWIKPRLNNALIKPKPENIAFTRGAFIDLLKIRDSSVLFRLPAANDIKQRLRFYNNGPKQNPVLLVGHLRGAIEGKLLDGATYNQLMYFVNVDKKTHTIIIPEQSNQSYVLHPVHLDANAADKRPAQSARYQSNGAFTIPARTALVFVGKETP